MRPILLLGNIEDLSLVYVGWLAHRTGVPTIQLSEETLGVEWAFRFDDAYRRVGSIEAYGRTFKFVEILGVFVRFHPHPRLPSGIHLSQSKEQWFLTERRAALHHLLESIPTVVVNPPSAGRSNGSKPHQMRRLAQAGFTVPRWIATNDPAAVHEFTAGCYEHFIVKSCSGLRSHVRRLDNDLMHKLGDQTTPVVVQEYIPGKDVRVHTVMRRVFPTEVVCPGVASMA